MGNQPPRRDADGGEKPWSHLCLLVAGIAMTPEAARLRSPYQSVRRCVSSYGPAVQKDSSPYIRGVALTVNGLPNLLNRHGHADVRSSTRPCRAHLAIRHSEPRCVDSEHRGCPMMSRPRLLFRLGPMMPRPQPARPAALPSSPARWLALATRDAALHPRPTGLRYHARRLMRRQIRVGRAAGAGCVDVGVPGGLERGENLGGGQRERGCAG